ncbi:YcaO-like family protein [Amycolatopsis sp. NBC_01480]|uniref:YcaO-like family protein n=1 Tax=Amycolatopsis sp. NBC_01480 TaxID=2903562 RepID=UPI002E2842C7|nr:YcaO-like family protein [Amycolatopsis sp. NBC_01480]
MVTAQQEAVKRYFAGTHRTRAPEETWALATGLFDRCGISRVADVTGLDVLGIPTWVAVRPLASTLSVSQGKGATDTAAKVSACMEAIELWYAENLPAAGEPVTASAAELALPYDFTGLQRAARSLVTDRTPLEWLPAGFVGEPRTTLVPRPCVGISSLASPAWSPPLLRVSSNGLASGNCVEEATLHALFELVERDATADLIDRPTGVRDYIAPETVDDPGCAELIARIADAGAWLELVDNTRDPHFPCYVAYLWSPEDPSIYSGSGCHTDPAVALSRSITEAAQSRLTVINGTRDDVHGSLYRSHRWDAKQPETPADRTGSWTRALERVDRVECDSMDEELVRCARLAGARTGQPVLAVPLTTVDEPLAVVRVVAPGLRFGAGDECPRPVQPNRS